VAVDVRIPTVFRRYTGGAAEVALEADTVKGLIDQLEDRFPGVRGQLMTESGELHRFVNVYVNDEDARYLDKLDTRVADGDKVALLPSVAGGDDQAL
jgi:MoaD family protein